jgi:hypothetical protein
MEWTTTAMASLSCSTLQGQSTKNVWKSTANWHKPPQKARRQTRHHGRAENKRRQKEQHWPKTPHNYSCTKTKINSNEFAQGDTPEVTNSQKINNFSTNHEVLNAFKKRKLPNWPDSNVMEIPATSCICAVALYTMLGAVVDKYRKLAIFGPSQNKTPTLIKAKFCITSTVDDNTE